MRKAFIIAVFLISAVLCCIYLYMNSLTFKVQKVLQGKDCTVSAAVISGQKAWEINRKKVPLMSVFKHFIALKVFEKIEKEKLSIEDKIFVTDDMVIKNTHSPMLKIYTPPFEISVGTLLKYVVSESDNNACDILLSYIGGLSVLQDYLNSIGFSDIEISVDEKMMEADFKTQYLNKAYPIDVIKLIKTAREGSIISENHKKFLDKIMIETITGSDKIKAGLPDNVVFGHKTGSSSRKPDGVKIADNDAGFVILPDGTTYYISALVTESKMSNSENAALIAEVSKIVYEHILNKKPVYKFIWQH